MTISRPERWRDQLERAVLSAKAAVSGWRNIQQVQHGYLLMTALAAFGDNLRATFYIETLTPNANMPRPDLIILHPDIGVLAIENKGITLEQIHAVEHTSIQLVRDGRLKVEDPFAQAERVMYTLKDLAASRFNLREALFLRTAAFPRIRRFEFEGRFKCTFPIESLFSDACHDPMEFRQQVLAYSNSTFRQQGKSSRLSRGAHEQLTKVILSGRSIFTPARPIRLDNLDPVLLGAQVQELELATKEATQQQRDLGRADLRGAHRLFRGVAGSGKSVMLALSTAQALLLHRDEGATLFEAKEPKRILVTCYNRSLVQYLRGKITERFGRIAWDKPSESELVVTHFEGLVKFLGQQNSELRTHLSYEQKQERARVLCARFDGLSSADKLLLQFDAVYVDEAQDLEPAEFEFLRRLARADAQGNQTLIIFYDNAQNIYGMTAPSWSSLGINIVGRTQFLDVCLRNTRQIIEFAFNILVGSYAAADVRVSTRQFADVASLRQRGLVEEVGSVFDVRFAPRHGPAPKISVHGSRSEEVHAAVREISRLIRHEHVLAGDVLILYKQHQPFSPVLPDQLRGILPAGFSIRQVDSSHNENKNLPLIEERVLTLSTIASAKGYDAPIVFLLGVDLLSTSDQDRALFYVAATRAKLQLYIFATETREGSLLSEIGQAAGAVKAGPMAQHSQALPSRNNIDEPSRFQDIAAGKREASNRPELPPPRRCQSCGSVNLHCQQGGNGYYFLCVDCTANNPLSRRCAQCGKNARVRARGRDFVRGCPHCRFQEVVHTNRPLEDF